MALPPELHQLMTPQEVRHFLGSELAEYELIYVRAAGTNSSIHKRNTDSPEGHVTREYVRGTGDCHYLHAGSDLTAAVSSCSPGQLRGFVSDGQTMLDIAPLSRRLSRLVRARRKRSASEDGHPHLARRVMLEDVFSFINGFDISDDFVYPSFINPNAPDINKNIVNTGEDELEFKGPPPFDRYKRGNKRTLELGLYVDKPARETFLPFFDNDLSAFVDFILGFINQIQALYYLPSLGVKVDITINYLEIMETQQMRHYGGERGELLTSFCKYNTLMNGKAKDNQWDMGLYLSGLNFFAVQKGRRSPVTMGLAVISGVCLDEYSCVIGELGTTNEQVNRPR
ncbi:uncharacterized protein LOC119092293 [Pollicipes pollicipes]|uniref:uncharacterized protein LOC119092293 n=1 Tax=Pollicipes pollicipes TaxID=41117 RepID=UPI0018852BA4|nr:uncharacterized protein LOC119092293 [Pollicipes pollicipes]